MHAGSHTLGDDGAHTLKRDALYNFRLRISNRELSTGDVILDNASARTASGDMAQINSGLSGHALGHRSNLRSLSEVGKHIALGDSHAAVAGRCDSGQADFLLSG